ncbi:MAG: DNA mismatch repair endonuclease MutL [Lachnospiraceae bacterium]|nr:DNA mismatch repair endonuclease MutL [Lachnospiraceae bacterium]
MPNIKVLDQSTINQIAAGEVIERPASIVKELLENAIDAKASAITVEIKEGGIGFIRITDNGCGIEKDDVKVAFLRHSTSKIRTAEDLVSVSSLGFRGEALSSIAAVCQVELITKTKSSLTGTRYVIEGGVEKSIEDIGVPDGTTFLIRNLFFNTPARRKFLKSPVTEGGYISDIVERIAISHPEVSIRFIVNNQNKLHTAGNSKLKDVIYAIYGREIASNLIEINTENDFMKVTGLIGKPVISRGNRNYENYFINGRYIKSGLISKAIEDAYKPYMMQHKYPFTALHVSIDSSLLDVNVHPTKMELRFTNQEQIYPFITKMIDDSISGRELIPDAGYDNEKEQNQRRQEEVKEQKKLIAYKPLPEPFELNRKKSEDENSQNANACVDQASLNRFMTKPMMTEARPVTRKFDYTGSKPVEVSKENAIKKDEMVEAENKPVNEVNEEFEYKVNEPSIQNNFNIEKDKQDIEHKLNEEVDSETVENVEAGEGVITDKGGQISMFDDKLLSKQAREKHVIVGQVFDTYWIVQFGDKMFIIDQHAAHEKVLYERMMARYKDRKPVSQAVAPPIILTLNMNEEALLSKYMDIFTDFGYEIEHFGGKEYAVRAVPYDLYSISKEALLMEILDTLSDDTAGRITPDIITEKVASMSCKAAVKGNNRLSEAEANELIDELLTLENPYNCPHGRPTIISMSKYELEKKFKRIV